MSGQGSGVTVEWHQTDALEEGCAMDDTTEVERLRARVAELEGELTTARGSAHLARDHKRSAWYAVGSALLLVFACVLAPLSVTAVWASTQVSDTEQYVQTVAPLAEDPAVQAAVADEVTRAVLEGLDIETFTRETLETLAQQENVPPRVAAVLPGLAVPITNGVESFTRTQITRLVQSPQFAQLWERVNTVAHEQLVNLLEGNEGGAVSAQGDTVTLNLAPIIDQVKQRLVSEGFTLAERVPTVDRSFVLVQSETVTNAQGAYRLLNTLGVWLPVIALAMFAAGVFLARDRRRAVLRGSLGVVGALLLFGVGLALARAAYVNALPGGVLDEQAAGNVFDTLERFLRTGARALAVAGLLAALAAFLLGPSTAASRTRSTLTHGIGSARTGAEAAGWHTGRFGVWAWSRKRALRLGTFIVAGLVLLFWTRPTVTVVVVTAVVVAVALALIEFLATPPAPEGGAGTGEGAAAGAASGDAGAAVQPGAGEPESAQERQLQLSDKSQPLP